MMVIRCDFSKNYAFELVILPNSQLIQKYMQGEWWLG
jgi:hypothetical protein